MSHKSNRLAYIVIRRPVRIMIAIGKLHLTNRQSDLCFVLRSKERNEDGWGVNFPARFWREKGGEGRNKFICAFPLFPPALDLEFSLEHAQGMIPTL